MIVGIPPSRPSRISGDLLNIEIDNLKNKNRKVNETRVQ